MGIKINEGQISMASHAITQYGEFLAECARTYSEILERVQKKGYTSDAVCAALQNYQAEVINTEKAIMEACANLDEQTIQFFKDMETINNEFTFPLNFEDKVSRYFNINF